MWTNVAVILQITQSTAVCVLAIAQFARQSVEMYRLTKRWQLNRYMSLLVKQGILSFLAYVPVRSFLSTSSDLHYLRSETNQLATTLTMIFHHSVLLFNLINVLSVSGTVPAGGWGVIVLVISEYVPIYTLTPRFILNMRELYAHDMQGRRGEGIDTGFGFSLSSRDAGGMPMVFADVGENHGLEDIEEIPMELGMTRPE